MAEKTRLPAIVIHGGAGSWSAIHDDGVLKEDLEKEIVQAIKAGWAKLQDPQKTAIDAVEAAVKVMESSPNFNAGKGSCLTTKSQIEMDASIMDGKSLNAGAITCIQGVNHPVSVARDVMEKSSHVMLAGSGAKDFALELGHDDCPMEQLLTEKAINRLKKMPEFAPSVNLEFINERNEPSSFRDPDDHDTVGAAALDRHGNVAYATSTGGITAKRPGRVGDSPIIGCGGFADNLTGATSTTGHGESFIRIVAGKHIISLMENGDSPKDAVSKTLEYMLTRVGGKGGAVAVSARGEVAAVFNTEGMVWASIGAGQDRIAYGVFPGECSYAMID